MNAFKVSVVILVLILFSSCAKKKKTDVDFGLPTLRGKKVVLREIESPKETKSIIEVALVNELLEHGHFEIVDKPVTMEAMSEFPHDNPADLKGLCRRLEADFLLSLNIDPFEIKEHQGFDSIEEPDSVLEEENGDHKKVIGKRYIKVKSLQGRLGTNGSFFDCATNSTVFKNSFTAEEISHSRESKQMGRLHLIESLSTKSIRGFLDKLD